MSRTVILCVHTLLLSGSVWTGRAMVDGRTASVDYQFRHADGVIRAVVLGRQTTPAEPGHTPNAHLLQVEEVLKGNFPPRVTLAASGQSSGSMPQFNGCQPSLRIGESRLFFVRRDPGGQLVLPAGVASAVKVSVDSLDLARARLLSVVSTDWGDDFTDQQTAAVPQPIVQAAVLSGATNLLLDTDFGLPARFATPDCGEPIPYLVDAELLPPGLSLSQAMNALSNALDAWQAVAPVEFRFIGFTNFNARADSIQPGDGVLRIQLHDLYMAIPSTDTLGIGGCGYYTNILPAGWTTGGRVFGNDFHRTAQGYVVLNDLSEPMTNAVTFEEVLCHEIGHALGMAHSTPDTVAPVHSPAWEAQMYYVAHEDGRGAAPTPWDTNVLQQVHPAGNAPPCAFDRYMDCVTASPLPSVPGANAVAPCRDRQGSPVTVAITQATSNNGSFGVNQSLVVYAPPGSGNAARIQPPSTSAYDWTYARGTDGVHWSPFVVVQVMSFSQDSYPSGASDGIPDNWMIANFGNANPAVGTMHGANDDKDGDGLTNRQEYRAWMNPNLATSAQRLSPAADSTVSWQGKAYELYELQASTNLVDWSFVRALVPTNDLPQTRVDTARYGSAVYRVLKAP